MCVGAGVGVDQICFSQKSLLIRPIEWSKGPVEWERPIALGHLSGFYETHVVWGIKCHQPLNEEVEEIISS